MANDFCMLCGSRSHTRSHCPWRVAVKDWCMAASVVFLVLIAEAVLDGFD